MNQRCLGIDIGAETIKVVELESDEGQLVPVRRAHVEHRKEPESSLKEILRQWDLGQIQAAAVTGRLSRAVDLPRIPHKQALYAGFRHFFRQPSATVVSIGSHGFAVLEIRKGGGLVFRENNRCSQGTGNFLRQLVERFDLSIEEASELVAGVEKSLLLSSRCPVILKSDITHLANKGEKREEIMAGLFDAICDNVQAMIKPRVSPPQVVLLGGVSRIARVRERFEDFLSRHQMVLVPYFEDAALFAEATGCAALAFDSSQNAIADSPHRSFRPPRLERLFVPAAENRLQRLPKLADYLRRVKRMPFQPFAVCDLPRDVVFGFDIGSTGSKAVLLDAQSSDTLWEGYLGTRGDPIGAARELTKSYLSRLGPRHRVVAVGVTGSGREIVGSLLSACFGADRIFIFNEIAAHATGAHHYDRRVDTIFEIGGQDAKYIRLEDGRVVDAAMNEACSAGTGSFIEEQGKRFEGIDDVVQLSKEALMSNDSVSLGQHCSVFMAEVIDEAVAAGIPQRSIIAGVYDAIVQNYLNRVKGNRSVGHYIFCQGMPFSAEALAAAVVRHTQCDVIVPPNPGTVGAFGIALLAHKELKWRDQPELDMNRFLKAQVVKKETFICRSNRGCGGSGNRCRVERLGAMVEGKRRSFTWGGACSLYDSGTGRKKLPDRAPDPFREKEELFRRLQRTLEARNRGAKRIALTDEFSLKELFPFFATFFTELGFRIVVFTGADRKVLKRGAEQANVPFCAPMKLYHGLLAHMVEAETDLVFLPMLRALPRAAGASHANLCPIVQGSADIIRMDYQQVLPAKWISPVIDIGPENLRSKAFVRSCRKLARELSASPRAWRKAYERALEAQRHFDASCYELGRRALGFCAANRIIPVVVLGRPYTIYNNVLNSNVPSILREQGVMAIPMDLYPIAGDVPVFSDMYWAHGQRNQRAAHQIRRTRGVYSIWCSNYSCGPDGFLLHFYSYLMEGKPFAVIETDGHSGDAGTKTRVEAFLYCVRQDLEVHGPKRAAHDLTHIEKDKQNILAVRERQEHLLIPPMGCAAEPFACCLRGLGFSAECLPTPDEQALSLGRRYTSGKECLPIAITLGSLLKRLELERDSDRRFAFFMPTSNGPCRFGIYNLLHKLVLERLAYRARVRVISPHDSDYFAGIPAGFSALTFTGFVASELLQQAFLEIAPVERRPGLARKIYCGYRSQLLELLQAAGQKRLDLSAALKEIASGRLYGTTDLLARAAFDLAEVNTLREAPTVLLTGEIYNRLDPFANDFLVEKLIQRGLRVHLSPLIEWLEYTDSLVYQQDKTAGLGDHLGTLIRNKIHDRLYSAIARHLAWHPPIRVDQKLDACSVYLRKQLEVESVLTIGTPLRMLQQDPFSIDGVVSVGPLECMPNKIAESIFFHLSEQRKLPCLTLSVNGDPIDPEMLDGFIYEIKSGFQKRRAKRTPLDDRPSGARSAQRPIEIAANPGRPSIADADKSRFSKDL
ncbi:MAG: CoA activase [Deltaproteobacteria bacterium]|nr:CoA activase [Deltaproteobacteria bacterium]